MNEPACAYDVPMLAARELLYALFQRLLGSAPSSDGIAVDAALVEEAYAELGLSAPSGLLSALRQLDEPGGAERLVPTYTACFEGPGTLPAPVWESLFVEAGGSLFQKTTLDVRRSYRAVGFVPAAYPHVADDHLAIELDFLRVLAQRAREAALCEDAGGVRAALAASAEFMDAHLLRWISAYAARLGASGKSDSYAAIAAAAAEVAACDRKRLTELGI